MKLIKQKIKTPEQRMLVTEKKTIKTNHHNILQNYETRRQEAKEEEIRRKAD